MTRAEPLTQLRWFLSDYAASPADRTALASDDTWGGNDTLGMAASFLHRDISVI